MIKRGIIELIEAELIFKNLIIPTIKYMETQQKNMNWFSFSVHLNQ